MLDPPSISSDNASRQQHIALPLQQHMWLMQRTSPDVGVANISARIQWEGPFAIDALQDALFDLVNRHPYLRTTVSTSTTGLVQTLHGSGPIPIEFIDARHSRVVATESLRVATEAPLDLRTQPWIRATTIRLPKNQYDIALVVSHLICDGISMGILCRELIEAYKARLTGAAPEWRHPMHGDLLAFAPTAARSTGAATSVSSLPLPYDRLPQDAPRYAGRRLSFQLTNNESNQLIALSRQSRVSPFVTWLSLLQLVISSYTQADQFDIDIVKSGRGTAQRRVVGPLLRIDRVSFVGSANATFADLLQANEVWLRRANHTINSSTSSRSTRSEVMLDYQAGLSPIEFSTSNGDHVRVTPSEWDNGAAIAELCLGIRRRARSKKSHDCDHSVFDGHVKFDTDLFNEATIARMIGHLKKALAQVASSTHKPLSAINLLTPCDDEAFAIHESHSHQLSPPLLVDQLFCAQSNRTPDAVAIRQGDTHTTFAELQRLANGIANLLQSNRVRHHDRVAIWLPHNATTVATLLGVMNCGAAYVPIDPHSPPRRQRSILEAADVRCVVTTRHFAEQVPKGIETILVGDRGDSDTRDNSNHRSNVESKNGANGKVTDPQPIPTERRPADTAYVIFTSGSTGQPKGVEITHANVANFFAGMDELQSSHARGVLLAVTNIAFDISIYELLWTMTRGYTVVFADEANGKDGKAVSWFAEQVHRHKVTHFQCTPPMMQMLLRDESCHDAIARLSKIFVGGDVMPRSLAVDLQRLASGDVYNMYGPTETTVWSTAWKLAPNSQVRIGRPLANQQTYVLDRNRHRLPVGIPGELYIGGDGVAKGYFRDDERTSTRYIHHETLGRLFRTGDIVRLLDDGDLVFLGRNDQQVKLHGHRFELGDVEFALLEHPVVAEAVVILVGDDGLTGNAGRTVNLSKRLHAFLVLKDDSKKAPHSSSTSGRSGFAEECTAYQHVSTERFNEFLTKRLPRYMVPRDFQVLDEFPLNGSGKIDRIVLLGLVNEIASPPRHAPPTLSGPPAVDSIKVEASEFDTLLEIIRAELGIEVLTTKARWTDLPVDSLDVIRLVARVESELGIDLPVADFFRAVTVEHTLLSITSRAAPACQTPSPTPTSKSQPPVIGSEADAQTDHTDFGRWSAAFDLASDESAPTHGHPFGRHVEPVKMSLLVRVGLDKHYVRGEGCYLWDDKGTRYVDCIAQYGALPFGYNPDSIWSAIQSTQQQQIPNVAVNSLLGPAGELAERLLGIAPAAMERVVFCNSGTEAIEVAIKLCRSATNRAGVLSTRQGFHGLTTGSLAATGSQAFQTGFFVGDTNFEHVAFGDAEALRKMLSAHPNHFAAFIVEPIQGEAGIVVPPKGYLTQVREVCNEFDVLLVVDEVQTGLGRTGRMFGCDHEGVVPDVMTLAKALGGGLVPIGAVLCQLKAYSARFGLRHSSTFAGNAVACQAGLATLDRLAHDDGRLVSDVARWGQYLHDGLQDTRSRFPALIRDVRGLGFMQAIEFDFTSLSHRPGLLPILAEQDLLSILVTSFLLHYSQVRVAPSFMGREVLRIQPPLIAAQAECDALLAAVEQALDVIESGNTAALVACMTDLSPDEQKQLVQSPAEPVVSSNEIPTPGKVGKERNASKEVTTNRDGDTSPVVGEFGFLVHLSHIQDLVKFDASLAVLSNNALADLRSQLSRSSDPAVVGTTRFHSSLGHCAVGHFVLVPYTPTELLCMEPTAAIDQVAAAARVANNLGVRLIGLGGFASIITHGGIALKKNNLPPLTSGNMYTVAATISAVEETCCDRSIPLSEATVAIVGASGQIGRALALILGEQAKQLILVGRDGNTQRTQNGLRDVVNGIVDHSLELDSIAGPIGDRIVLWSRTSNRQMIAKRLIQDRHVTLASNLDEISHANIIVASSSAVRPIIQSQHIRPKAVVCDCSRPPNVSPDVIANRLDVTWIKGGLVRMPKMRPLDLFAGPNPNAAYACVAEAALWTLEPSLAFPSVTRLLEVAQIRALEKAGRKHGFEFVLEKE